MSNIFVSKLPPKTRKQMFRQTMQATRETKFSGTNKDREILFFPVQLTTCRTGNLTRVIHTLAICVTIHTHYIEKLRLHLGVRCNGRFFPDINTHRGTRLNAKSF